MYNFLKENFYKYGIVVEFILSIILWILAYQIFYEIKYLNNINYIKIVVSIIILTIIGVIIVKKIRKHYKELEKIFVVCMIPIGIAFLIFVIPNYVYDETNNIARAYDISNGNIFPQINENGNSTVNIPKQYAENNNVLNNSYKTLSETLKERTDYNENVEADININPLSTLLIPYIPTSLVFMIAKIINLNFFIAIYISRFLNFIIFLLCGYYAIKIIPFGKLIMLVYLFVPMIIHQAISLSSDSIINSILILFLAYNLYLFKTKVELTRFKVALYYLLSFFVASQATLYFPLIFLSLLIYNRKDIKNKKKFFIILFVIVILGLGLNCFGTSIYENNISSTIYYNIDKNKQLQYIIEAPINFLQTMYNTLVEKGYILLEYFIGTNIGFTIIDVNKMLIILYIVLLVVSTFYKKEDIELNNREKTLFIIIFILCIMGFFINLYLNSTALYNNIIDGIHGKILIPLIILLLLCLKTRNKNIELKNSILIFILLIYLVNSNFISEIINYFLI